MKHTFKFINRNLVLGVSTMLLLASCNKDLETFPNPTNPQPSGLSLSQAISPANNTDSLFSYMVARAGLTSTLANTANRYTVFMPTNQAIKLFVNAASGGAVPLNAPDAVFAGFIQTSLPAATATSIVSYLIDPQTIRSNNIPSSFPNFQYPSIFNPAPSVSALLRLTNFPSTANGAWFNNVPISSVNEDYANGVIHRIAFMVTPPQRYLWDRINTDNQLTYLKAAILRADSGATSTNSLVGYLQNIGANFTVFAPTDAAFQATITAVAYQTLVNLGVPPATALVQAQALASSPTVFSNPALYGVLTAQTVKGIVVYHILGSRAFTNNFPTTATAVPTLLNGVLTTHPGVTLTATFSNPFVASATVKGVANATAANVIINASPLTPDPAGTSDQHYLNGTLHKIDQVLLPQ